MVDFRSFLFHYVHQRELTLGSFTSGSSLEELNKASTDACGASLPLKFVVSISNPKMVPAVPSFMIHLHGYTYANLKAYEYPVGSPVVIRIVSASFPTTVERAFWSKLTFQAWRGLPTFQHKQTVSDTGLTSTRIR